MIKQELIRYCRECVMPVTKPDLEFDQDGVCNACNNFRDRISIDWMSREKELDEILDQHKKARPDTWNCVIPVSGGKDSTFQVLRMIEYGMNPLCVNSTTCDLTPIGRENLENIKSFGVDLVELSPNPKIRGLLNRIGLTEVGDISWPEHVGIFTLPIRIAVSFGIPLIVWGENSQNEYGGPRGSTETKTLDRRWLEEFGGLLGMRVSDLAGFDGITKSQLSPYTYPPDADILGAKITGLFLGYFLPWDGLSNALIAQAHGFRTYGKTVEGSMVDYENLDNYQTGVHDYFKFLKFGFGRATDIACLHVRRGRLSRHDAIKICREHDGQFPHVYLGKELAEILHPLGLTIDQFQQIADQFTNKALFRTKSDGNLYHDENGNLEKINYDNV